MDIADINGLPAFEAYEVRRESITVEALAGQLVVAPEDLTMYNDIYPGRILEPDEWIFIALCHQFYLSVQPTAFAHP